MSSLHICVASEQWRSTFNNWCQTVCPSTCRCACSCKQPLPVLWLPLTVFVTSTLYQSNHVPILSDHPLLWDEILFSQVHWCMTVQTKAGSRKAVRSGMLSDSEGEGAPTESARFVCVSLHQIWIYGWSGLKFMCGRLEQLGYYSVKSIGVWLCKPERVVGRC